MGGVDWLILRHQETRSPYIGVRGLGGIIKAKVGHWTICGVNPCPWMTPQVAPTSKPNREDNRWECFGQV